MTNFTAIRLGPLHKQKGFQMTTVSHSPLSEVESAVNALVLAKKRKDALADGAVTVAKRGLKDALQALSDRVGNNAPLRSKACNSLYWKYNEIPEMWIREIFRCRYYIKPLT